MAAKESQQLTDYRRVARAIEFIADSLDRQPGLEEIADHLHLSPYHCQRMFRRWAGLTPKQFLQVLTLERSKQLLANSNSLLDAADKLGLSGSSRLHDHFVTLEAVTPGEFKRRGKGVEIGYGLVSTPFGKALVATTDRGICKLAFVDSDSHPLRATAEQEISALKADWPEATYTENSALVSRLIGSWFDTDSATPADLRLHVRGTNFQIAVWRSLLRIPEGELASYSTIASAIGKPSAHRAVGTAIGANPVGYLIPCHRVIRQSGALGGYRWGETRKRALLAWESTRHF